ncbi:MAG: polymer-forming cytoskeletal protein, partial [Planctomycetota bacterium]
AITVSCPSGYPRVAVEDVRFKGTQFGGDVRTCGEISIVNKSRVQAKVLQASRGVDIQGRVDARLVAGESISLSAGAQLRGDCNARTIRIEPGARIDGGYFRVGGDPSGDGSRTPAG